MLQMLQENAVSLSQTLTRPYIGRHENVTKMLQDSKFLSNHEIMKFLVFFQILNLLDKTKMLQLERTDCLLQKLLFIPSFTANMSAELVLESERILPVTY